MPAPKKKSKAVPGMVLIKHAKKEKQATRRAMHEKDERSAVGPPDKSVTEMGNLEEFLADAELADRNFQADRESRVFQVLETTGTLVAMDEYALDEEEEEEEELVDESEFRTTMPRRPHWIEGVTTAEELDKMEKEAFLEWRRELAQLEVKAERHGFLPSPFEKNLNFWRQLWRVMERADVLVQVVDARNPLLFRFEDMEIYAKELSSHKRLLLLVNKADMLTEELRKAWAEYFLSQRVEFVFFSAKQSQEAIDNNLEERPAKARWDIFNRSELLKILEKIANAAAQDAGREKGVVGMVGYPNVGKSSVINALLGAARSDHQAHRVSVSATPGHTKHFQTMIIGPVTLCDCPGLVFPSFFGSKAEMLCNGVLPIDEIRGREFMPALEIVCERVPRRTLEEEYKMKIRLPLSSKYATAETLIDAFCRIRGLYAQGPGRIDEPRGSRLILKDFVSGKLLYCHPPPGYGDVGDESEDESGEGDEEEEFDEEEEALHVNEAADLLTHTFLPIQTEDEVLFEAEEQIRELNIVESGPSRRLARHGRKHKKARDKNPYDHGAVSYVAKVKGAKRNDGEDFTRKSGFA